MDDKTHNWTNDNACRLSREEGGLTGSLIELNHRLSSLGAVEFPVHFIFRQHRQMRWENKWQGDWSSRLDGLRETILQSGLFVEGEMENIDSLLRKPKEYLWIFLFKILLKKYNFGLPNTPLNTHCVPFSVSIQLLHLFRKQIDTNKLWLNHIDYYYYYFIFNPRRLYLLCCSRFVRSKEVNVSMRGGIGTDGDTKNYNSPSPLLSFVHSPGVWAYSLMSVQLSRDSCHHHHRHRRLGRNIYYSFKIIPSVFIIMRRRKIVRSNNNPLKLDHCRQIERPTTVVIPLGSGGN